MSREVAPPAPPSVRLWGAALALAVLATLGGALLPERPPIEGAALDRLRVILLVAGIVEGLVLVQIVRPQLPSPFVREAVTWGVCLTWVAFGLLLHGLGGTVVDIAVGGGGAVALLVYFCPRWSPAP